MARGRDTSEGRAVGGECSSKVCGRAVTGTAGRSSAIDCSCGSYVSHRHTHCLVRFADRRSKVHFERLKTLAGYVSPIIQRSRSSTTSHWPAAEVLAQCLSSDSRSQCRNTGAYGWLRSDVIAMHCQLREADDDYLAYTATHRGDFRVRSALRLRATYSQRVPKVSQR